MGVAKARWLEAFAVDPTRAEALYQIAKWYKDNDKMQLCALYARRAVELPYPVSSSLFIEGSVYDFHRHDIYGICAWYTKQYEEGYAALKVALANMPEEREAHAALQYTRKNLKYYRG